MVAATALAVPEPRAAAVDPSPPTTRPTVQTDVTRTVWRCGNTYAQTACGEGRRLDLDDPRDAAQRGEALATARRERALGDAMERDRLDRERALRPSGPGRLDGQAVAATPPPAPPTAPRSKRRRTTGPGALDFQAFDPSTAGRRSRSVPR